MTYKGHYFCNRYGCDAKAIVQGDHPPFGWMRIEGPLATYHVCGNCQNAVLLALADRPVFGTTMEEIDARHRVEEEPEEPEPVRAAEGEVHQARDERGGGEAEGREDQQQPRVMRASRAMVGCSFLLCESFYANEDDMRLHLREHNLDANTAAIVARALFA